MVFDGNIVCLDLTSVVQGDCLVEVTQDTGAELQTSETSTSLSLVSPRAEEDSSVVDGSVTEIGFDTNKKFVRITGIQQNRLIEFDFSVGEPEIYIELVLPFQAFQDFCATNKVKYLTPEQAAAVDYDRLKWRSGSPGIEH